MVLVSLKVILHLTTWLIDDIWSGMPRVTSLKLDYNKIKTIHDEAFYGLEGWLNLIFHKDEFQKLKK